jgi:signal peptidase I
VRRPVALLLTVAAAGAGHFALGRRRRAVLWIVAFQVLIFTWAALLTTTPIGGLLWVAVILASWLAVLVDVLVVARSVVVPRWFMVGSAAVVLLGLITLEREAIRRYVTRAYTVPSSAMRPALEAGDYFLADKTAYRRTDPRRGDITVFRYPRDPGRTFVMRVIGLPGERMALRGRDVRINGASIAEPYVAYVVAAPSDCRYAYGCSEIVVPTESYFVMGDNRDNSLDSRYWGFVPRHMILGRASVIYWSVDPRDSSIRFRRIASNLRVI